MKQRTFLTIIFVAAFLFLAVGISQLAVTDPVESNYALTALEMVRSGDWLSPQIYGTYWYDKPIFLYWLLSLSYSLLGTTDLAARLPAVLFGTASCTLAAWFALRQTGRRTTAILFAAMTVTSLIFWFVSRSVITDQPLYFFSGATLFFAYIGLTEGKKGYMTGAYVMAAGAVLTKGPVGLVLPGLFLLLFTAIQRRPDYLKRLFPPAGIVLFLLLCLIWYGPMYSRHGMDFIDGLLGFNNVVRATVSEHPEYDVWYYYLVLVPISLLPWTGPCLYGLWRRRSHHDEYVFMAIWASGQSCSTASWQRNTQPMPISPTGLSYTWAPARCRPGSTRTPAMPGWQPSSRPPSTACSSPYWWPLRIKRLSPSKACCC